ncbi:Frataxin, mitochondrial [Trichoplax sp. H2]|nr:Frataxin, mitochondrial [Trichoplax sp. H2]|eukprot:RDD37674.1 Frataxin, mitochondrial [Trichoplax sp. H2]
MVYAQAMMANIRTCLSLRTCLLRFAPANQVLALKVRSFSSSNGCCTKRRHPQDLRRSLSLSVKSWPLQATLLMRSCSSSTSELDALQYNKIADETLENLTEFFENLNDQEILSDDYDASLASGVLTIHLGDDDKINTLLMDVDTVLDNLGTYVINKQVPNKQIWLSSPLSGPKRYDYLDGKWVYSRNNGILHDLLSEELTKLLMMDIDLNHLKVV